MIGSGQHIWIQMWGPSGEIVQDGILYPGADIALRFTDGPQLVSRFALTRITKVEADQLEATKPVEDVF